MYGPGYPHRPPPPRPSGLSPLAIVLIVVGVTGALGAGACVVLGGLVVLGASAGEASSDPAAGPSTATTAATATSTASPAVPADTSTATAEDDPAPAPNAAPTAGGTSTSNAGGGPRYFCNATGWVRVCGFANVCNNQMVSGIGSGTDRFMAMTMAKNACEGMARAKGGATVCTVACTMK